MSNMIFLIDYLASRLNFAQGRFQRRRSFAVLGHSQVRTLDRLPPQALETKV